MGSSRGLECRGLEYKRHFFGGVKSDPNASQLSWWLQIELGGELGPGGAGGAGGRGGGGAGGRGGGGAAGGGWGRGEAGGWVGGGRGGGGGGGGRGGGGRLGGGGAGGRGGGGGGGVCKYHRFCREPVLCRLLKETVLALRPGKAQGTMQPNTENTTVTTVNPKSRKP